MNIEMPQAHINNSLDLHKKIMQMFEEFSLENSALDPEEIANMIDLSLVFSINSLVSTFKIDLVNYLDHIVRLSKNLKNVCEKEAVSLKYS